MDIYDRYFSDTGLRDWRSKIRVRASFMVNEPER